jgi:hypothetical protein
LAVVLQRCLEAAYCSISGKRRLNYTFVSFGDEFAKVTKLTGSFGGMVFPPPLPLTSKTSLVLFSARAAAKKSLVVFTNFKSAESPAYSLAKVAIQGRAVSSNPVPFKKVCGDLIVRIFSNSSIEIPE